MGFCWETAGLLYTIKKIKGAKTKQKILERADGGNRERLMENLIVHFSFSKNKGVANKPQHPCDRKQLGLWKMS